MSPPPSARPTRVTRSSTRVTRKSVTAEVTEDKQSKPETKSTRGRKPKAVVSKQTENSTESETEKQPEPPKRASRRKANEPSIQKPAKGAKDAKVSKVEKAEKVEKVEKNEKPEKAKRSKSASSSTAATTTTTTTTTTSTAKSSRTRGSKRSAAATVDHSETPDDEDEAPKPKRATRARTSTTPAKEKPAPTPRPTRSSARASTRTSTRASSRGKKKEEPATDVEESEVEEKESISEKPIQEIGKSSPPSLEKIDEETDSMVANDKSSRDPEILPAVVDVVEGIKEQVERTVEEIKDSDLNDTVPDAVEDKENADDASSVAETRDSLDVNLDNNSVREMPDDDKSVDDKSNDDKSSDDKSVDEKPEEPLANEISISDIENDKTIGPAVSKEDQILPNASLENGEREVIKDSGDSKDMSVDRSLNDTEDDIGLDETLPMEALVEKNGEVSKRKTDDLDEEDNVTIAIQKQVKKPRTRLLEVPDIPHVSGQVMTFGDDMCGELGLKEAGVTKTKPVPVKDVDEPAAQIASGGMHNVCLTSNGHVYTWGCNDEGALGRVTNNDDDRVLEAEPTKVPFLNNIVKVSAGDSHSSALTSTGQVYFWGNFKDSNGKYGVTIDSEEGQFQPILIELPNTTFVDIASGIDHLLLLSDTGEIYSVGTGEQGQLGRASFKDWKEAKVNKDLFLKPGVVKFDDDSTICDSIWAGQYSSYARTKTGDIYAWGLNNYSQLGIPQSTVSEDLMVPYPILIPSFSKCEGNIEQICPGQHFMIARDSKGKVYSCGRHEYGRLGLGKLDESFEEPKLIKALDKEKIVNVAAGSVTAFAVTEKGDLYAWGMGESALGLGKEDAWEPTHVQSKLLETQKVVAVAAGSQHTAIIVQPKED